MSPITAQKTAAAGACISPFLIHPTACPGEVGSGSPIKDRRQRQNLQRFLVKALRRVNHYEREAL